jgi:hypothetical protein
MRRTILLVLPVLTQCAAPPPAPVLTCPSLPAARPPSHEDPLPPVSATPLALQPGHWDWVRGGYVWASPAWVDRPGPNAPLWLNGFWTPTASGCAWTPGHFLP